MLNRRDALKTLSLTTAAALAGRLQASAQTATPAVAPAADLFVLPPLPFAPDALEPRLDAQTMTVHHSKHHAAYVQNLNKALAPYPKYHTQPLDVLLGHLDLLPPDIMTTVRNNGGGHANHSLFWKCLTPASGEPPQGDFLNAVVETFGSFANFQEQMTKAALGVFGSGWAWLSLDSTHKLRVESLPNQDSPLMFSRQPVFGLDVWEHAYYLRYQNRRAEYLASIWNVVDWQFVAGHYAELMET